MPLTTVVTPPSTPPPDPYCPEPPDEGGGEDLCCDGEVWVVVGDDDGEEVVLEDGASPALGLELELEEGGAGWSVVVGGGPPIERVLVLPPVKPGTPGCAAPLVEELPSGAPGTAAFGESGPLGSRLGSVEAEVDGSTGPPPSPPASGGMASPEE